MRLCRYRSGSSLFLNSACLHLIKGAQALSPSARRAPRKGRTRAPIIHGRSGPSHQFSQPLLNQEIGEEIVKWGGEIEWEVCRKENSPRLTRIVLNPAAGSPDRHGRQRPGDGESGDRWLFDLALREPLDPDVNIPRGSSKTAEPCHITKPADKLWWGEIGGRFN